MQITAAQTGGWTVLTLDGRIDDTGSKILKEQLLPLMTGGAVALDFTNVEYVTSSGFRVLMMALKEQHAKQGRLLLGNMSEPVRHFFDVAGLSSVFKITHRVQDAITDAP